MGIMNFLFNMPDWKRMEKELSAEVEQWEFIGKGKKKFLLDEWDTYTIDILDAMKPYDQEFYRVKNQVWYWKRYTIDYKLVPNTIRQYLKDVMLFINSHLQYIEDPAFRRRLGTVKPSIRDEDLEESLRMTFKFFGMLLGMSKMYNIGMPKEATFAYNKKLGRRGSDELMLKYKREWIEIIDKRFGKVVLYCYNNLKKIEFFENGVRMW